jgi:hypothetical protein
MGHRPNGMTLDRINNNGNYEPTNCRWATHKEQTANGPLIKRIKVEGVTKSVTGWAEYFGISQSALSHYVKNKKVSFEQAVKMKLTAKRRKS